MIKKRSVEDLIERYYRDELIGQRALEKAISDALNEGHTTALDAGCGSDAFLTRRLSDRTWVVGIDLSQTLPRDLPVVCGDLSRLPLRDSSFSLIFSRSVFEHLLHPDQVLGEFWRILKPNGLCIILTPNRFDYTSIAAAVTPQRFHEWFVRRVYATSSYDTFPTVYRANTPGYFTALAKSSKDWRLRRLSGLRHYPANLAFSRILFRLGVLYDWMIARARLTMLQPSLLVVLQKSGE